MIDGVISGSISGMQSITGHLSAAESIAGELTIVGGIYPAYRGAYEVVPKAYSAVVLETQGKRMLDNVTVQQVPYYETSNPYGDTVYIASEV